MAQAMALSRSFCGQPRTSTPLKFQPLSFNPNCSSSRLALFKSKPKAPPSRKVEKPRPRVEDGIFGTSGGIGFARNRTAQPLISAAVALSLLLGSATAAHGEVGGAALFNRACIGCHYAGGNVIQPGATLFAGDLERNGVATEEEIFRVTYAGKGRMPGFGEQCTPRGQCTFGPRLNDDEIRLLAQFVKAQAQQGWPKID